MFHCWHIVGEKKKKKKKTSIAPQNGIFTNFNVSFTLQAYYEFLQCLWRFISYFGIFMMLWFITSSAWKCHCCQDKNVDAVFWQVHKLIAIYSKTVFGFQAWASDSSYSLLYIILLQKVLWWLPFCFNVWIIKTGGRAVFNTNKCFTIDLYCR